MANQEQEWEVRMRQYRLQTTTEVGVNMSPRTEWNRVTRDRPCPVCGKPDWCLFAGPADFPTAVICPRTESDDRRGDAGWLHRLRDDEWDYRWRRTVRAPPSVQGDFGDLARQFNEQMSHFAMKELAETLGLTRESLRRLEVGWSGERQAWTFPMSNANGDVVGIRLRLRSGRKLSIKGSREGLFLPGDLKPNERLLICEGPTDTAAMMDLGFQVVGRPNCNGGVKFVCELVKRLETEAVVCVADSDEPGQRGAERLVSSLMIHCPDVRIVSPPDGVKDARAWKAAGATMDDIAEAIESAAVRKLKIVVKRKNNGR